MAKLRYRWGTGEVRDTPTPPTATLLTLLVDNHEVWTDDVTTELWTFARECTLGVAHLWECPEPVRHYFQTGTPADLEAARAALPVMHYAEGPGEDAANAAHHVVWQPTHPGAIPQAEAAEATAWALARAAAPRPTVPPTDGLHPDATQALDTAHHDQAAKLRAQLLRRALPPHLHSLVDDEAHEAVLCDALLEATHG